MNTNEDILTDDYYTEPKEANPVPPFKPDSIVQYVMDRFYNRAKFGKEKYGVTLDRDDLNPVEWIQHLQDELHDSYVYSEKIKREWGNLIEMVELMCETFDEIETGDINYEMMYTRSERWTELREWYEKTKKTTSKTK